MIVLLTGDSTDDPSFEHNHAYAMVNYDPSQNLPFEVFNPWGVNGGTDTGGVFRPGLVDANEGAIEDNFDADAWAWTGRLATSGGHLLATLPGVPGLEGASTTPAFVRDTNLHATVSSLAPQSLSTIQKSTTEEALLPADLGTAQEASHAKATWADVSSPSHVHEQDVIFSSDLGTLNTRV
jgi:hypothetical protein